MRQNINNLMKYRYLLVELIKKDIKLKYRRSYMGYLWTLLEPLLTMLVLCFVFKNLRHRNSQFFPVYVLSGRLIFSFFSNSTKSAMKAIRTNGAMIKKVYVPKYIYPISAVLSNFVMFLFSLVVLVGVSAVLRVPVTKYLFGAVIPLILILLMATGFGLILSTMAVFFRDLEYLWGVALTLIMYCSAIFYDMEIIDVEYRQIFQFNPVYLVIYNFRNCILEGSPLDQRALLISAIVSFGSLIIGIIVFYKKQDKFILNI